MTLEQHNKLYKELGISSGEYLAYIIRGVLNNLDLTLIQDSTLDSITEGGDYRPKESILYKSVLEVLELANEEKIDKLLILLKRLPFPEDASSAHYFIEGIKVSRSDFFQADKIEGRRSTKGTTSSGTPLRKNNILSAKFVGTRLGETLANELLEEEYFVVRVPTKIEVALEKMERKVEVIDDKKRRKR